MLTAVNDVIDAVGGTAAAAELAGVGSSAVSMWRSRGRIPSEKYMIFVAALCERGLGTPDPTVFGMHPVEK